MLARARATGWLPTFKAELDAALSRIRFDTILVVLERPSGAEPTEVPGLEIRQAEARDGPAYQRDVGTDVADTVAQRLAAPGSSCWIGVSGGCIVHASWVATQQAWVGEADRFFVVPPGHLYIYQSFTRPEARGRGIYPAVLATIAAWASSEGLTKLWIAAEDSNHSSLRAMEKAGFTPSFEIEVHRRWGRSRVIVPPGVEPQLEERQTGPSQKSPGS